jgi:hypothetical protein
MIAQAGVKRSRVSASDCRLGVERVVIHLFKSPLG